MNGTDLPALKTPLPGPASRARVDVLARHECPAITARRGRRAAALGAAHDDPIVWAEAVGANVRDADDNVLVDLTSGFGVAFVGHRHPAVVAAAAVQSARLVHAMGDAWPDLTRIALLERLASLAPGALDVSILGLSGSDAVEGAVKTAMLATGRSGVLAFAGGYHGLTLGAVPLQGYKPTFADPFRPILPERTIWLPWGCDPARVAAALEPGTIGLVLVEPVQGRGGMRPPPPGWLAELAGCAQESGALLAFDEIQTGIGRTGTLFAADGEGVVPDLMCIGKALGGGYPLSACIGTRAAMDAWGASRGEALHTQTFLGHPVGCAAALAVLDLVVSEDLPTRALELGAKLTSLLRARGFSVRGRGLMIGIELGAGSLAVTRALLRRGYLTLPGGSTADVVTLTPPVCLTARQTEGFVEALVDAVDEVTQ